MSTGRSAVYPYYITELSQKAKGAQSLDDPVAAGWRTAQGHMTKKCQSVQLQSLSFYSNSSGTKQC